MVKYIINGLVHGYEKATVDKFDAGEVKDSEIVVLVDKACDQKLGSYYKMVSKALKNNNRVILLGAKDDSKSFQTLASLMATFNAYDIYLLEDSDNLTVKKLELIESRVPTYSEVQTFIGGAVTAYADMTTILFGIQSLIDEGNEDKLREFLEEHLDSIENFTTSLNIMKKTCDVFNSTELIDEVNMIKDKETKLRNSLDEKSKLVAQIEKDRDDLKKSLESYKSANAKIQSQLDELKTDGSSDGGAVIKNVKTIQTQLIDCKTKLIIYFREISYVAYVNSMVCHLMEMFERSLKLKTKLMIYDDRVGIGGIYGNLTVVTGIDYASKKNELLSANKLKKFVVAEPNPAIMTDMLQSSECFDVVIVYDRLKTRAPLVAGNNVSEVFIANSSKEFKAAKDALKLTDSVTIITNRDSSIMIPIENAEHIFNIPSIEAYTGATDSAKLSRYMKLVSANGKKLLTGIADETRATKLK